MNTNRLALPAAFAFALIVVPVAGYISMFGFCWSRSQEVWGQFGDFFGGVLNPLYALLAFFAVLFNIRLQSEQLTITQLEQQKSSASTQAQLDAIRDRALRDELIAVMRALDSALNSAYDETVTAPHSVPALQLKHIVHEGWRLRTASTKTGAYFNYVHNAQASGSIVEALHTRLRLSAESLAHFASLYESIAGSSSPMAEFYRARFVGLGQLLRDVGGTNEATVSFFSGGTTEVSA
jgi:hypothetical protein